MAQYSIGQVEKITGVKPHVLRYWEETFPGFAPRKDYSGRRVYSQRDIEIILRLKYLIYDRKFTIEGAKLQIIEDSERVKKNPTLIMEVRKIRSDLSELFFLLQKNHKSEEK